MKPFMRATRGLILTTSLVWVAGCGGSGGGLSTTEATVKGIVNIDGKHTVGGEIIFTPTSSKGAGERRITQINQDGTFVIKTLTGPNTVKLGGPRVRKNQILEHQQQSLDVIDGENTLTFDAVSK